MSSSSVHAESGELPGGCSGNGGMSLGCSAGAGGCSADIPVVGLDTVTFTCGLPTYDPPTPDFDQSFYRVKGYPGFHYFDDILVFWPSAISK